MNERYRLNSELIRAWLRKECRKHSYVGRQLGCSDSLVDKMLAGGHVPKEETLNALATMIGVPVESLLLTKERVMEPKAKAG